MSAETADNESVDDFDFSDLDLEGGEDNFDEPAAAEPRAKKGPDIMTLAIYGVIGLAVIGAAVWQLGLLGGSTKSAVPQEQQAQADGAPQAATSDPFNVMGTPSTTEQQDLQMDTGGAQSPTGGVNPDMADAMTPSGAGTPTSAAIPLPVDAGQAPGVTSVMPVGEAAGLATADSAIPGVGTPSIPSAPAMDAADSIPMPNTVPDSVMQTAVPEETTTTAAAAPTPVVTAQPAPSEPAAIPAVPAEAPSAATTDNQVGGGIDAGALTAIMDRLDAIEKRLDAQNNNDASPAMANELQELKATVARLEAGGASSVRSDDMAAPVKKASAPVKKKSTAKKKTTSKSPPKRSSNAATDAPYNGGAIKSGTSSSSASGPVSSQYRLRSAQQDVAWISDGSGSLREVRVGDMLPGVGEVRAIQQSGGTWSIVGSDGRISP